MPNAKPMGPTRIRQLKRHVVTAGVAFTCALATQPAAAELKIGEAKGWEIYTNGQVGAFLSYQFGDGYPPAVAPPGAVDPSGNPLTRTIVPGGGLPGEIIPESDDPNVQGRVSQWRVRNGFSPNVLGFGARKKVSEQLKLKVVMSIWGTIEPPGQQKQRPFIEGDFREGFGQAEGPWGAVTIGRHLGLFSRGIVDLNFRYLHQYGLGYPGSLANNGPTAGLINFGVLAAFFSPGIMYSTPKLAGLQLNLGVYDAVQLAGSWEIARTPRPEFELTYSYEQETFNAHAFVNGAYQKLYLGANKDTNETAAGLGFGGRAELGPFRLGAGGHYGRGLGLAYALQGSDTTVGPIQPAPGEKAKELRTFSGYSVFAQYAPGKFDINAGFGQSRVHLLKSDEAGPEAPINSVIKTQTGVAVAFVYHITPAVHWDIDYMRAMFRWYKGEKQDINFVSSGLTLQW